MKICGCERGCVGFPPTPEVDVMRLLKIAAMHTRFVAYGLPRNANKKLLVMTALEAGYDGASKIGGALFEREAEDGDRVLWSGLSSFLGFEEVSSGGKWCTVISILRSIVLEQEAWDLDV